MTEPLTALPDWVLHHHDPLPRLVLELAWFVGVGAVEHSEALDTLAITMRRDASRFDRITQLVVEAETFTHEPHAAVDSWNGATRPGISYDEAIPMALQLRADAIAEAGMYARSGLRTAS